jgi:class 3 adenylate cyclase/DNA-binding beta-propeller fold protein YncE
MNQRGRGSGRRVATVLFTDVVGSTELAARIGDRKWRELLATYRALVRRTLRRTGGREVDDAGDGFFAVFDHPADAIACACLLADEVRASGLEVRSGIHMGEAETAGPKPGGIAVHIGARVCSQAGPGQVLVSATVRDVVRGSEYGFVDLGDHALKGVPGEMRLYSVTWTDVALAAPGTRSRRRYVLVGAPVVAVVVAAAVVLTLVARGNPTPTASVGLVAYAGTGRSGDGPYGGAATAADLDHPTALALDPQGRLYIVASNRVLRVNANGTIVSIAGTGVAGFSGDGGPATLAELNTPAAIAFDPEGDLFIADSQNNRIREVDLKGIIGTFAGNDGPGLSGDGNLAIKAELSDPMGVAVGFGGVVYIADSGNNRVREVDASGRITTLAGDGQGYAGDGQPAASAVFNDPQCLAVDAQDNLYIADTINERIRQIGPAPAYTINTVAGSLSAPGFSGDKGPARNARLQLATGPLTGGGCIAVDAAGDLFIADALNNRVREVSLAHVITTVPGAQLDMPLGVAVGSDGTLYIADSAANRVFRLG